MAEVKTEEIIEIEPDEDGGARYRLPYGIAKGLGLNTDGMTPRQVWDMLKKRGVNPDNEYEKLKEKATQEIEEVKVEEVKIEDVDGSYSEKQKEKIKNFRKDYQKKTHEFGLVLDGDGNTFIFRDGKTDAVGFYPSEYKQFAEKSLIHNHPQGNTFLSPEDIELFASTGLRTIEAVGYDGGTHIVELLPNASPQMLADFVTDYRKAIKTVELKAEIEWYKQPKKQVKSGKYLINVPETWELYRKGASPRDSLNFKEYAKIYQDALMKFSKDTEKKYGVKSIFRKENENE